MNYIEKGKTSLRCPYCLIQEANSRDHIFPRFLGGKRKIHACRKCNSMFGHDFESNVCRNLEPFLLMLRRSGLKSPAAFQYRDAFVDKDGAPFNIDQDLNAIQTKPTIERNNEGKIIRARFGSYRQARKMANALLRSEKAKQIKIVTQDRKMDIRQMNFKIKIGKDLNRLVIKMFVALINHLIPDIGIINEKIRGFLLNIGNEPNPVRFLPTIYSNLEKLRSPLSHTIYIEGAGSQQGIHSFVQLFGLLQFYISIKSHYGASPFAIIGNLDWIDNKEEFGHVEPVGIPRPSKFPGGREFRDQLEIRILHFHKQIAARGNQSPLAISVHPEI